VRTSEWVIVAYFAYLFLTSLVLPVTGRTRRSLGALAVAIAMFAYAAASAGPSRAASITRDWIPGACLMLGYWATGLLYRGPNLALERRLESVDLALAARLGPFLGRVPRLVVELLETSYLFCYPLVPVALAVLYLSGLRARADEFWTLVLTATFVAYGVLPWAGTRPPRALEPRADPVAARRLFVRRINLVVLDHASIQVNTFPSGHAAAASAVTLFLAATTPWWVLFAVLSAGIVVGAVVGRYHYALDVIGGVGVAVGVAVMLALAAP
jgi:membrane-associated phospholipid phosphatase